MNVSGTPRNSAARSLSDRSRRALAVAREEEADLCRTAWSRGCVLPTVFSASYRWMESGSIGFRSDLRTLIAHGTKAPTFVAAGLQLGVPTRLSAAESFMTSETLAALEALAGWIQSLRGSRLRRRRLVAVTQDGEVSGTQERDRR